MTVQPLAFGQSFPKSGGKFLRLKEKNDFVQFRIAQDPVYDGKHFQQVINAETGGLGWDVSDCLRINEGLECELCSKFFEINDLIKKFKEAEKAGDEHPEVKKMKTEARKYSASIQFYFPILDRGDGSFKILQTTNGVRNKLNAQYENGIDVKAKEWVLKNTGSTNPNEKYSLSLVDSADVKPLTEDEKEEWEKAKSYDLSQVSKSGGSEEDEE